jgi:hypothetical protein
VLTTVTTPTTFSTGRMISTPAMLTIRLTHIPGRLIFHLSALGGPDDSSTQRSVEWAAINLADKASLGDNDIEHGF